MPGTEPAARMHPSSEERSWVGPQSFQGHLANLHAGAHLCLIDDQPAEQIDALASYCREGLAREEQCRYFADGANVEAVLWVLRTQGVQTDAEVERGALVGVSTREAYLRDGRFDPDAMLRLHRGMAARARADGFAGSRVAGDMRWVLGLGTDRVRERERERFLEFEAKLNEFALTSGITMLCQYDLRSQPSIIYDVLRTHPLAAVGGDVHDNVYFEPAAAVLAHATAARQRVDWMLDQLQTRTRRTTAVAELGRRALAGDTLTDLVEAAMRLVALELRADFTELIALVPPGTLVRREAGIGWRDPRLGAVDPIDHASPLPATADRLRPPVIVPDWRQETRFEQPAMLRAEGIVSSARVAIQAPRSGAAESEGAYRVLGVHSRQPRIFAEDELDFLMRVAVVLACALAPRRGADVFRTLVEHTPDAIARLDKELRYVYVNQAVEQFTGVSAESLIGKTSRERGMPEPLVSDWEIILRRAWQTGESATTEFSISTPLGERHFHCRIVPEPGPDGSVQSLLVIGRDLTEQRQAERERSELYREVVSQQARLQDLVARMTENREHDLTRMALAAQAELLTAREREVLRLLARGLSNPQLATELHVSVGTVKLHLKRIFRKLKTSGRTQAALRAVELESLWTDRPG